MAAIFSMLTIFISCKKPAMIAGRCSPIEAIRFTAGKGKANKSENGIKAMAWRNMFRDKKKAVIVLSSFIVSMVIFFTINVVIKENDSKSILNETYSYDLQLVNETLLEDGKQVISKNDIKTIEKIGGVKDTRTIYSAIIDVPYQENVFGNFYKELYQSRYAPGNYDDDISGYKNGDDKEGFFQSKIIGIDQTELKILTENAGIEIDNEKFEKGEIALTCGWLSINPIDAVGKTLSFALTDRNQEQKVQISGIVDDPSYFASGYTPSIIISENRFMQLISNAVIELVYIDYSTSFDEMTEKQVRNIFINSKELSVDSKLDLYYDMLDSEKQIRILGNGIGFIIAILSIMNYINMMAAGVENRKKEFAILESIGMTRKQIRTILVQEGAGYAIISIILSIIIGLPISYIVFRSINIYGITFSVPILSNIILFVCTIVPPIVYRMSCKGTVLERMKINKE